MPSLIVCEVCGKECASDASQCPHCGSREQLNTLRYIARKQEERNKRTRQKAQWERQELLRETLRTTGSCGKCGGRSFKEKLLRVEGIYTDADTEVSVIAIKCKDCNCTLDIVKRAR